MPCILGTGGKIVTDSLCLQKAADVLRKMSKYAKHSHSAKLETHAGCRDTMERERPKMKSSVLRLLGEEA